MPRRLDGLAPWLVAAGLTAFFWLKKATLGLSFFWDEIVVYAYPAQVVFERGFQAMHPLADRPATLFFGHPPAYASSIAFFYHLFGASPWSARFFTFLLAVAGLVAMYRLMKLQYGAWAGFVAMALLATEPNYFVQSTQVLADVALMALIPVVLYLAAAERLWAYALVAAYLVLVKETALAVVVAVPVAKLLVRRRLSRRELIAFSIPVFSLVLFFLDEKVFTGKFSNWPPGQQNILQDISDYPQNLARLFRVAISQREGRNTVFLAAAFCGLLSLLIRRGPIRSRDASWIFLAAAFTVVFLFLGKAMLTDVNEHYFIPLLPPLLIVAVGFAWRSLPFTWLSVPALTIYFVLVVQIPDYYAQASGIGDPHEGKLNYIDVVHVQDEALAYVRENYPGARVHAVWPINSALTLGVAGFPPHELSVKSGKAPGPVDVLIWSEISPPDEYLAQERMIAEGKLRLDRVFERNGKKISIFRSAVFPLGN